MKYLLIILLSLIISSGITSCDPLFFRGRPFNKHGMIGSPVSQLDLSLRHAVQPSEQWYDQKLNHFDPVDTRTWKQRYYVSDTFYKRGGPVFLQLGGEGTADPIWLVEGQIATNYAKKFNALSVLLEHRYYGKSWPTPDMSVDNLRYLTSQQSLQDSASFVEYLTEKLSLNGSKWIVFGGSYSGSLAAWMRAKYPHLVDGAIASSAPIQAVVNFKEYLGVVSKSLGDKCDEAIREATNQLAEELKRPMGWRTIEKQFKLCDTLNGTVVNDVYNLMQTLASNVEGVVQYNKDNRDFEGARATNITIDVICDTMTDISNPITLDKYIKVNDIILEAYDQKCLDFKYNKFIKQMQSIDWKSSAAEGGRQWTYQTCVEFGFYQSSDLKTQPFGPYFPIDFFTQQCTDIFGDKYNLDLIEKSVDFTNNFYGGFGLKVRKVLFPNGSIDPWHALGVTTDLNPEAKALMINGTAHCADMYPNSDNDTIELTNARKIIVNTLHQFLNNHNYNNYYEVTNQIIF
ncbi:putative serine protease K12H4.7 [Oppia nitens]|uniref:putative serine protease K12H4.7 n=1 Tax=Oppia nitens TaxID=1686743 RepID=UPI0023DC06C3|nr:putative serine protease K12H4.7 [Oppia nitens]